LAGHLIEDETELLDRGRVVGLHVVRTLRSGPWAALVLARTRD
jgi:hypothetical protein